MRYPVAPTSYVDEAWRWIVWWFRWVKICLFFPLCCRRCPYTYIYILYQPDINHLNTIHILCLPSFGSYGAWLCGLLEKSAAEPFPNVFPMIILYMSRTAVYSEKIMIKNNRGKWRSNRGTSAECLLRHLCGCGCNRAAFDYVYTLYIVHKNDISV